MHEQTYRPESASARGALRCCSAVTIARNRCGALTQSHPEDEAVGASADFSTKHRGSATRDRRRGVNWHVLLATVALAGSIAVTLSGHGLAHECTGDCKEGGGYTHTTHITNKLSISDTRWELAGDRLRVHARCGYGETGLNTGGIRDIRFELYRVAGSTETEVDTSKCTYNNCAVSGSRSRPLYDDDLPDSGEFRYRCRLTYRDKLSTANNGPFGNELTADVDSEPLRLPNAPQAATNFRGDSKFLRQDHVNFFWEPIPNGGAESGYADIESYTIWRNVRNRGWEEVATVPHNRRDSDGEVTWTDHQPWAGHVDYAVSGENIATRRSLRDPADPIRSSPYSIPSNPVTDLNEAPQNLRISSDYTLMWDEAKRERRLDTKMYQVCLQEGGGGSFACTTVPASQREFRPTDPMPGVTYTFYVVGLRDGNPTTGESERLTFSTPTAPTIQSASGGEQRIDLQWSPGASSSPITGWQVRYRRTDGATQWRTIANTLSRDARSASFDIPYAGTYNIQIAATSAYGAGAYATHESVAVTGPDPRDELTVTIVDPNPASASESDGATTVTVRVTIARLTNTGGDLSISLNYGGTATYDGTTPANGDYLRAGMLTHTINESGPWPSCGSAPAIEHCIQTELTITPNTDNRIEGDETIIIGATGGWAGQDDPEIPPAIGAAFTITDATSGTTVGIARKSGETGPVNEGESITFTATFGADVEAARISWPPHDNLVGTEHVVADADVEVGSLGTDFTIALTDDMVAEGRESMSVSFTVDVATNNADRAAVNFDIAPSDPITITVTGPDTVREGEPGEYVARLSGGTHTADVMVTVAVGSGGTGQAADVTLPTTETQTIPVGLTSATFSITFVDDEDDEDETIEISITGSGGAGAPITSGTTTTTITQATSVDFNSDAEVNDSDALILYYVLAFPDLVGGSDQGAGFAASRTNLLGTLVAEGGVNDDTSLIQLVTSTRETIGRGYPDINSDSMVNDSDALILYYVLAFPDLVGGSDQGAGFPASRTNLLGTLVAEGSDSADAALVDLVGRTRTEFINSN